MSKFPLPPSKVAPLNKGMPPPQAVDIEKAVLGALMIDNKCANQVMNILEPEIFYLEIHRKIFEAIKYNYENNIPIDLLTISTRLKQVNELEYINGDYYLISLTQLVSTSAHIEYHSRIVIQKYILRQLIKFSSDVIKSSYQFDADSITIMNDFEQNIANLYKIAIKGEGQEDSDDIETMKIKLLEKVHNRKKGIISGFLLGFNEFDQWSGGLQLTDFVIMAARPSMGKSTVAVSFAKFNAFVKQVPTAFFSLEMSKTDIYNKLTAGATGVLYSNIRSGELNDTQARKVADYYSVIKKSALEIYDTSFHKNYFSRIESKIRELVEKGFKFIIIDYLQLIKLLKSSGNDTSDLSKITRALKALCNELNITIMCLSQLNRKVEDRPDKTPSLGDLKQSGSIEEDADVVIFLLRDAYYQLMGKPEMQLPLRELGKTKFIVAKGRHVGVRTFLTYVDMLKSKIESFDI